jgi:hypothetical protein
LQNDFKNSLCEINPQPSKVLNPTDPCTGAHQTLNPKLKIPNSLKPWTLNSLKHNTSNPTPFKTLNHGLWNLPNAKPQTRTPTPHTLNPQPALHLEASTLQSPNPTFKPSNPKRQIQPRVGYGPKRQTRRTNAKPSPSTLNLERAAQGTASLLLYYSRAYS